jgi:hypothetical protein
MLNAFWLAVAAAVVVAVATALLERPREWTLRTARRVRRALSPRRHEDMQRAIERIAAELASRRYQEEGNPDHEYYDDWYRWLTGDPNADVGYARKQKRDLERLERGDFRRK